MEFITIVHLLQMNPISASRTLYYLTGVVRWWLAIVLLAYGLAKLSGLQFGITPTELDTPLKQLSLFKVSWYLASQQPFSAFVGFSQVVVALLLAFRKTMLAGALLSVPIWLNILVWDISFMVQELKLYFIIRLSFYLLLTAFLMWTERKRLVYVLRRILTGTMPKLHFPVWAWIMMPFLGIFLESLPSIPGLIRGLISAFGSR